MLLSCGRTHSSKMPEANYLLSVSWGYIKVCIWVCEWGLGSSRDPLAWLCEMNKRLVNTAVYVAQKWRRSLLHQLLHCDGSGVLFVCCVIGMLSQAMGNLYVGMMQKKNVFRAQTNNMNDAQ